MCERQRKSVIGWLKSKAIKLLCRYLVLIYAKDFEQWRSHCGETSVTIFNLAYNTFRARLNQWTIISNYTPIVPHFTKQKCFKYYWLVIVDVGTT
jgi:hypothetical protein